MRDGTGSPLLHLIAVAKAVEIEPTLDNLQNVRNFACFIVNMIPSGKW